MTTADRRLTELRDILALLPGEDLVWSLYEFYGFGGDPEGLEKKALASPSGYVLTWPRLVEFARGIRQTVDCTLVAVERAEDLAPDSPERGVGEFVLVGHDSTVWELTGARFCPALEARFRAEFCRPS